MTSAQGNRCDGLTARHRQRLELYAALYYDEIMDEMMAPPRPGAPGELSSPVLLYHVSCAGDQVNENAYDIRTLARRELPNSSPRCRGGLYAGPYTRYIQTPAFPIALARHDAPSPQSADRRTLDVCTQRLRLRSSGSSSQVPHSVVPQEARAERHT